MWSNWLVVLCGQIGWLCCVVKLVGCVMWLSWLVELCGQTGWLCYMVKLTGCAVRLVRCVLVGRFYTTLFSALEQTHSARL